MISLYGKHLWKTTKSRPLQPLIIILSVAVSVAIFVSALFFQSISLQKIEIERTAMFNNSDIRITVSSQSSNKYFEYSNVTKHIDQNDIAECYFSYFVNYKDTDDNDLIVPVLGVDFAHINQINKIEFKDSKKITNQNQNDIIIISESFAKSNKLYIDDEIGVSILGTEQRFVIIGIAKNNGYFLSNDIILSIDNFMRILMAKTPIPILGSNIKYFNTAIIKLADSSTKNEKIQQIQNSEVFKDKQVEDSINIGKNRADSITIINKLLILLVILCCSVVSMILMYTTYEIFMGNRLHTAALFKSVGATQKQMILLLLSEVFVYSLLGSILGLAISSFLSKLVVQIIDISSLNIVFPMGIYFYGFLYGIILALVCVIIPITKTSNMQLGEMLSGTTKRYKKPKFKVVIYLLLVLIVQIVAISIIPNKWRFYGMVAIFLTVIITTIFSMSYVTAFFSKLIEFIWNRFDKKNLFNLALKNSKRNLSIQNANRIFCVAAVIVIVLLNSISYVKELTLEQTQAINFDYYATTLLLPSDYLYEDVRHIEGVDSVHIVAIDEEAYLDNNISYPLIGYSGRLEEIFPTIEYEGKEDELRMGEVAISKSLALIDNYKVGDKINVKANNISHSLKIVAILDTNSFFVITPVDIYNLKYNHLIINENEDVYEELSSIMNEKVAMISTRESIVEYKKNDINKFILFAEVFIFLIIFITIIGTINSIFISLRARKDEFLVLSILGMKNREKLIMIAMEFFINFIGIFIIILLSVCILNFSIMEALKYFGVNYNKMFL